MRGHIESATLSAHKRAASNGEEHDEKTPWSHSRLTSGEHRSAARLHRLRSPRPLHLFVRRPAPVGESARTKRVELTRVIRGTRLRGVDGPVAVLQVKVLAKCEDDVFLPHLDAYRTLRKANALGERGECAVTVPSH